MVDALKDVWRVLAHGGTLLDLRPLGAAYRLELVTPDAAIPIGQTDTTGKAQDDAAADAAVARVVDEGLFARRSRVELDVEIFWDSVDDLQRFVATREGTRVTPSYEELKNAYRSAAAGLRTPPRLRTSRRLVLAAFERADSRGTRLPPSREASADRRSLGGGG
jgi:hypothetical protein